MAEEDASEIRDRGEIGPLVPFDEPRGVGSKLFQVAGVEVQAQRMGRVNKLRFDLNAVRLGAGRRVRWQRLERLLVSIFRHMRLLLTISGWKSSPLRLSLMLALFAVSWWAVGCGGGRVQEGLPAPPVPVTVTPASGGGGALATPVPPLTPAVVVGGDIEVAAPRPGEEVRSPVRVRGRARVFEGNVQIQVRNSRGMVIGNGYGTASAGAPEWGTFNAAIMYHLNGGTQAGVVEVFSTDPKDGRVANLVSVPVSLAGTSIP